MGAVLWFSMHSALTSFYAPFPAGLLRAASIALPRGYTNNSAARADRGEGAWQAPHPTRNRNTPASPVR